VLCATARLGADSSAISRRAAVDATRELPSSRGPALVVLLTKLSLQLSVPRFCQQGPLLTATMFSPAAGSGTGACRGAGLPLLFARLLEMNPRRRSWWREESSAAGPSRLWTSCDMHELASCSTLAQLA